MKILLIRPYWPYPYGKGELAYNRIWSPTSLATCAAILEKDGHYVRILDAHALRLKPNKTRSHLIGYDQIFITSSPLDRWQCPNIDMDPFYELMDVVHDVTTEYFVMGSHGTANPNAILEKTKAKAIMRSGPELTVQAIANGKPFSEILGLTYWDGEVIHSNDDITEQPIATYPTPAFHLLDVKKYKYEILGSRFMLFELGRGCNFPCKFCNKIMYAPSLRSKTSEQMCEELRVAIEDNGVRSGYFIDLEFLHYKKEVQEVCKFLIEKNYKFKWCCQTRADSLDAETLALMKQAGCQLVHIGVEGGLQKYLDMSGKHTTEEKIFEGVRLCREAGIKTLAFFMFGFSGETEEDRDRIYEYARRLDTDYVSFHKVHAYLESDMYISDLETNTELDKYVRKAFLKYYCRPSILKKENFLLLLRSFRILVSRCLTLA